jgi:hypothetical protein
MNAPQSFLVPAKYRQDFYGIVDVQLAGYNYHFDSDGGPADAAYLSLEGIFTNQAIAALDLGLGSEQARDLIAEAALAGVWSVQYEPELPPRHRLSPLFGLMVTGDKVALKRYAQFLLGPGNTKPPRSQAHLHALTQALAHSILEADGSARKEIKDARKALETITKPKSLIEWSSAMTELAERTLAGRPSDLSPLLARIAIATNAWLGRSTDIESHVYESFLARMPLAFVARAHARGFKLPSADPAASMVMSLLQRKPRKLPDHPWHTWPQPRAELKKLFAKALNDERSRAASRSR